MLGERLGATGVETQVWLTADQVPIVAAGPKVKRGLRRRSIAELPADELDDVVTLAELCSIVTGAISLGVADTATVASVVEGADAAAIGRLWFRCTAPELLREWRSSWPEIRLVDDTRLAHMTDGPERRAASLGADGITAVRMPYPDWTGGLATLFHRFDVYAFGWDGTYERMVADMHRMGLDAISTPNPELF